MPKTETVEILSHDTVGTDARLLRLKKPDWSWNAGELVSLNGRDATEVRDYTIASGAADETLDILYRLIPHGLLTPQLAEKRPGDLLTITGPYGSFTLRDPDASIVFCATGTGVAPCRAFLRSHPNLNLTLLHGVRTPADLYFREEFKGIDYHPFCSREPLPGRPARLTAMLPEMTIPDAAHFYLCGANEMIYEATDQLKARGVSPDVIFNEPYYYRLDD